MHTKAKAWGIGLWLIITMVLFSSCQPNEEASVFQPLLDYAIAHGYEAVLTPLAETGEDVPIFNASVWYRLMLDQDEVLVYYDSSNRAKQLAAQFCNEPEDGHVYSIGLRFILLYRGDTAAMDEFLTEWQGLYPV